MPHRNANCLLTRPRPLSRRHSAIPANEYKQREEPSMPAWDLSNSGAENANMAFDTITPSDLQQQQPKLSKINSSNMDKQFLWHLIFNHGRSRIWFNFFLYIYFQIFIIYFKFPPKTFALFKIFLMRAVFHSAYFYFPCQKKCSFRLEKNYVFLFRLGPAPNLRKNEKARGYGYMNNNLFSSAAVLMSNLYKFFKCPVILH